jgi:hypothetical protein
MWHHESRFRQFILEYLQPCWDHPRGLWELEWDDARNEWRGYGGERRREALKALWRQHGVLAKICWLGVGLGLGAVANAVTFGLLSDLVAWLVGASLSEWPWLLRMPFRALEYGMPLGTAWLLWQHSKVQTCDKWSTRSDDEVIAAAEAGDRRRRARTIVTAVAVVGAGLLVARPAWHLITFWLAPVPQVAMGTRDALLANGRVIQVQNMSAQPMGVRVGVLSNAKDQAGESDVWKVLGVMMATTEVRTVGPYTVMPGAVLEVGPAEGLQVTEWDVGVVFVDGCRLQLVE